MPIKLLTIDIETSPATAYVWSLGKQHLGPHQIIEPTRILCFAAKWYGQKGLIYEEARTPDDAAGMVERLWELLDEADAVIHYNGTSFDMPHINREFLLAGLQPPSPYAQIDLWRTVRSQFRFMSNKLDEITKNLGLARKASHEGFDLWKKCLGGDDAAWKRMRRYNMQDVRITEELYETLLPWIKSHPSVNLVSGEAHTCPTCGSAHLEKRGFARTKVSTFQRYRCLDCGTYSRAGKRLGGVDIRGI